MANYRTEWQAISDRIDGLIQASTILQSLSQMYGGDEGAIRKDIAPHARAIYHLINKYSQNKQNRLPKNVADILDSFIKERSAQFGEISISGQGELQFLKRTIPALASVRAEVNYLLSDTQAVVTRMTERAFLHLQRSIIVDKDIKDKWVAAFEAGETECEKLGAVHLLLHGIWAFKANTPEERTDLVLGEPLTNLDKVAATAEALVLTEWKMVRNANDLHNMAGLAYQQASRYVRSTLAGFELADYRYLVFVSEKDMVKNLPLDKSDENGITYRHINIAVNPESPSSLK